MFDLSRIAIASFLAATATAALAESPRVVTDIPPVHSLVAQVMEGIGTPALLLEPGADPHNHAMRPSQANALQNADVIVAIGPALTPWLEKPLETLPTDATVTILLEAEGTTVLEYRDGHGDSHGHSHGHDHGDDFDPHAWLDPTNANVWLTAIAKALTAADPARADQYQANAAEAQASLNATMASLQRDFEIGAFGVHHDAFQYFETWFGIEPAFIIEDDDADRPGPARIAKLRAQVANEDIACVFVEAGVNRGLVETVLEGSSVKVLELDPLGAGLEPGNMLYQQLLARMVDNMRACQ